MAERRSLTQETQPVFAADLPELSLGDSRYEVDFARTEEDLDEALRLRFEVFNLELGEGLEESYETGRDQDPFDIICHHLIVRELASGRIVGCYRLQTHEMANRNRGFYSDDEFDLSQFPNDVLDASIELGRACVATNHRSTQVLFLLWKGLAQYVAHHNKRYLFGCSSLTSQDPEDARSVMGFLERKEHLHPEFRVETRPNFVCPIPARVGPQRKPLALKDLPALFRIYLRHGATVCSPPAIDRRFKTIDFLVLFDVNAMPRRMFRTFFG